eukprot:5406296-Pyramimonas_sp.AAC.1
MLWRVLDLHKPESKVNFVYPKDGSYNHRQKAARKGKEAAGSQAAVKDEARKKVVAAERFRCM